MKISRLSAISVVLVISLALMACAENVEKSLNCPDMAEGCSFGDLNVRTSQSPQILEPFELRVQLNNEVVSSTNEVYASFAMDDMEMGLNRYKLIKKADDNLWVAEVTLPVCVRGRADWVMQIETKTRLSIHRYMVNFQTNQ